MVRSNALRVPPNLDRDCPDLPTVKGKDGRTLLAWASKTVQQYQDCQDQSRRLREAWPR